MQVKFLYMIKSYFFFNALILEKSYLMQRLKKFFTELSCIKNLIQEKYHLNVINSNLYQFIN